MTAAADRSVPAAAADRAEPAAATGRAEPAYLPWHGESGLLSAGSSGAPDITVDVGTRVQNSGERAGLAGRPGGVSGRGGVVDWLLVVGVTLLAGWTAVLGIFFLPFHIGAVPLPISALLGVAAMLLAPRAGYGLTGSLLAAALPVAAWFAVSVYLVLARSTLMVGLPVTVINGQWRVMLLLGLGSLAAAATLGLIWGDRLRDKIAAERSAADARDAVPAPMVDP